MGTWSAPPRGSAHCGMACDGACRSGVHGATPGHMSLSGLCTLHMLPTVGVSFQACPTFYIPACCPISVWLQLLPCTGRCIHHFPIACRCMFTVLLEFEFLLRQCLPRSQGLHTRIGINTQTKCRQTGNFDYYMEASTSSSNCA